MSLFRKRFGFDYKPRKVGQDRGHGVWINAMLADDGDGDADAVHRIQVIGNLGVALVRVDCVSTSKGRFVRFARRNGVYDWTTSLEVRPGGRAGPKQQRAYKVNPSGDVIATKAEVVASGRVRATCYIDLDI